MLKQVPFVYTAYYIKHNHSMATKIRNDRWVPARPLAFSSNIFVNTWNRLKIALGVYTGKYDALYWEDDK